MANHQNSTDHTGCRPSGADTPGASRGPIASAFGEATWPRHPASGAGEQAEPPAVPAALVGHPRYEVLGVLGSGGMGAVYKARHRLMDRLVALKVIRPDLIGEPAMLTRFEREARAAARLSHPNIVTAYDADRAGNTHFLVMEYVAGADLDQVLAGRGRLALAEACEYARQAALGLQHAHEQGMAHRDIKPQNLMLTPQGRVKILDFGLARLASETYLPGAQPSGGAGEATSDLVLGTLDYLAPEQALSAWQADIRADVYSLGCTLYRFLSGQVPFPGCTYREKLKGHLCQLAAPLADFRDDVPPGLALVVARMMAKEPAERYQVPAEVAEVLAPFASPRGRRVLVVEDDPVARRGLAKVLEAEGFTVLTAANGQEALDQLRQGPRPGLVLLDLRMPVMDGLEFLQEQRKDPALAGIPVVVVSATDPVQARAVALGAVDYLRKPVDVEDLTGKVHRHAASDEG